MQAENGRDARRARLQAQAKYKPTPVKLLLVAESPPSDDSARYFYFEDVREKDALFLEVMKTLYPELCESAPQVRRDKLEFLRRFSADGLFLIDAVEDPLSGLSTPQKVRRIRNSLPELVDRINEVYLKDSTLLILISAPVYQACAESLQSSGYSVLNEGMIEFPGSGGQRKFREKMKRLIATIPVKVT